MGFSYQVDLKLFIKIKCKAITQSNRTYISDFKIPNFLKIQCHLPGLAH